MPRDRSEEDHYRRSSDHSGHHHERRDERNSHHESRRKRRSYPERSQREDYGRHDSSPRRRDSDPRHRYDERSLRYGDTKHEYRKDREDGARTKIKSSARSSPEHHRERKPSRFSDLHVRKPSWNFYGYTSDDIKDAETLQKERDTISSNSSGTVISTGLQASSAFTGSSSNQNLKHQDRTQVLVRVVKAYIQIISNCNQTGFIFYLKLHYTL